MKPMNASQVFSFNTNAKNAAPEPFIITDKSQNPTDSPCAVKFCPVNSNIFSCTSWDQKIRIYSINNGVSCSKSLEMTLDNYPLSQTWNASGNGCFVALGDNSIVQTDFSSQAQQKFGTHQLPILHCQLYAAGNFLVCFDTDKTLLIYSISNPLKTGPNFSLKLGQQPFCASISGNTLLLGCSGSRFAILDLPKINQYSPSEVNLIESALASPISAVHLEESSKDFFLGSSDGRVYKGFYTQQQGWSNKPNYTSTHNANDTERNFTYLAQAKKQSPDPNSPSDLFNINAMGGHPRSKQFLYTTGSDGVLHFWDTKAKNKTNVYSLRAPVTCCDISPDGNHIAFGLGYDWSQGVWGLPDVSYEPSVGFKRIADSELVYK